LFIRIIDTHSNVFIRTRLLGEMWHPNFLRLLTVTPNGVIILIDEVARRVMTIPRTEDIIQFELDQKFENYHPHFHYDVRKDWE
jgi:hypothetical protein